MPTLDEAEKLYPLNTQFKCARTKMLYTVTGYKHDGWHGRGGNIIGTEDHHCVGYLFWRGEWAISYHPGHDTLSYHERCGLRRVGHSEF